MRIERKSSEEAEGCGHEKTGGYRSGPHHGIARVAHKHNGAKTGNQNAHPRSVNDLGAKWLVARRPSP